jgi:hypothetical protein
MTQFLKSVWLRFNMIKLYGKKLSTQVSYTSRAGSHIVQCISTKVSTSLVAVFLITTKSALENAQTNF